MKNIIKKIVAKKEVEKVEKVEKVEEPVIANNDMFIVVDANGKGVRTYVREIHGKDAEKLAKQFALKINGEVI